MTPIPKLTEFATPSITIGASAAAGTANTVIRSDSTIAGVALITSVDNAIARFSGTAGQLQGYTSNTPTIADDGVMSVPGQPAFLAYVASTISNVTGDNTSYTVVFGTEVFDQNADFDGVSTFTAPITGRYRLTSVVALAGLTSSITDLTFKIVTSNREYVEYFDPYQNLAATNGLASFEISVLADMDASDTATVVTKARNGTKVVDIYGSSDLTSLYCAELVA